MRFLLVSGLGPTSLHAPLLDGTLLADEVSPELLATYERLAGRPVDMSRFTGPGGRPLLRPSQEVAPHLPTSTVRSILELADIDYTWFDATDLWNGAPGPSGDFDVVGLSTTFVWDQSTLARAVRWIAARYPSATLVLGGQYSNLKYAEIFARHPEVDYVVRGDAELALPALLEALDGRGHIADVPNLAWRSGDEVVAPPIQYIDIESHPSPVFRGPQQVVPYESMRGCPFTCKFCSFPSASPKWRYKSAPKIVRDWAGYAERNEAEVIRAYDSTFTIPPPRFRELLDRLPALGVPWEGYSRANTLGTREVVERLEASHCRRLFVGFEAMNATALRNMDKKVSVAQNRAAIAALRGSSVELRASFMVGYPGETPEDYQETHRFLLEDFAGRFHVHFFLFNDETMPVWDDAPRFGLEVDNAFTWKHAGMDSHTAQLLRYRTLHDVRWGNDQAVNDLWQLRYARPLLPGLSDAEHRTLEKTIERLAFLGRDKGDEASAPGRCRELLATLERAGVGTGGEVEALAV
ncbi:MAG: radical SAM protein [Vicinamibacterales bacterium]